MEKLNELKFIEKCEKVHNHKYDYSKVKYVNSSSKICIICPVHGEFWQVAESHLLGFGCRFCGYDVMKNKQRDNTQKFIEKARKVHGDKYDYSKVEYVNANTKVCIICPEHGEFWQKPSNHLRKHGCDKCGGTFTNTTDSFIEKAKKVHGDKYDYSKVVYKNNITPVCIICPEHGEFWQTPDKHLQRKGCPKCVESKKEEECRLILESLNIKYVKEKKFNWLKDKTYLRLDFYLPEHKIAIEYQGEQHFIPIKCFGGEDKFKETKRRDNLKSILCEAHGIKVEYITYKENLKTKLLEILKRNEIQPIIT